MDVGGLKEKDLPLLNVERWRTMINEALPAESLCQGQSFSLLPMRISAAYSCAIITLLDRVQFPLSVLHFVSPSFLLLRTSSSHHLFHFEGAFRLHPFFAIYCFFQLLSLIVLFASPGIHLH